MNWTNITSTGFTGRDGDDTFTVQMQRNGQWALTRTTRVDHDIWARTTHHPSALAAMLAAEQMSEQLTVVPLGDTLITGFIGG